MAAVAVKEDQEVRRADVVCRGGWSQRKDGTNYNFCLTGRI